MTAMRSVLSLPSAYRFFWNAIGGPSYIRRLVEEYVKPQPGCRILDIGCGPGTILPYLPDSDYVGFDASAQYIEAGRRNFPQAKFLCARVNDHAPAQPSYFDVALALGILHHIDDAEALRLFEIALEALKPGGKLVSVDGVWAANQSAAARYLIRRDRGKFVRSEEGYVRIASQVFTRVKATIRDDLLRIPYTHIIMECIRSV
jgi:SAM-dependent methyltransferase